MLPDHDGVTISAFTMADRRGYLLETDCQPWGKELVEGGAPPQRC